MRISQNAARGCGKKFKKNKKCRGSETNVAPKRDVSRLLAAANQERQIGRWQLAEQLYHQLLDADPRHAEALYQLGSIAIDKGRYDRAVDLIRRAIRLNPASYLYHANLGHALDRLGRTDEAAAEYHEALRLNPGSPEVMTNLGGVLLTLEQLEEARAHLEKAVGLAPTNVIARANLALALLRQRRLREALAHTRKAVELAPNSLAAVSAHATLLVESKYWREAQPFCERWVSLAPEDARAHQLLANSIGQTGRKREAAPHYWKALQLKPDYIEAANNLGLCLAEAADHEAAMVLFRRVIEINPDFPPVWTNMGESLRNLGQFEEAVRCHDRALALEPDSPQVLWNRSLCLLALGRLKEGWAGYDCRGAIACSRRRPFTQPYWNGSDPAGKTILVWMEQGLGDEIAYSSLVPDLLRLGAHCVVECDPRLVKIFARSFGGSEAVPRTDPANPRTANADIDFQAAIGSLFRHFRPTWESFPRGHAYLVPDPLLVSKWRERVAGLGDGLKVGICWRSMLHKEARSHVYSQLNQWGPILTTPGVQFVNLQYDECAEELHEVERLYGSRIAVWDDMDLRYDQEGVAALISALDLVLSAGTSVDQMAGALGAPTWVLVRHPGIWALGTDHCPWHPGIRAFFSPVSDPWEPAIQRMASELAQVADAHRRNKGPTNP